MWVSRAKCSLNIALDVLNCSSKLGPLVSLFGEIGGVAYSGDMQPTSERSAHVWDKIKLRNAPSYAVTAPVLFRRTHQN